MSIVASGADSVLSYSASPINFSINVSESGANHALVVFIMGEDAAGSFDVDGGGVGSVAYNGDALTFIRKATKAGDSFDQDIEAFYLVNPDTGTNTLSITPASATTGRDVALLWALVDEFDSRGADGAGAAASGTAMSANITTTTDGATILGAGETRGSDGSPFSPGTGVTPLQNTANASGGAGVGMFLGHKAAASAGAHSFAITNSASQAWNMLLVELVAAAGGAPVLSLTTETDSALAVSPARAVTAGQAQESDAALAVTPARAVTTGQAAETDAALAVTPARAVQVGIATESDSALALEAGEALGLASEADSALPVAAARAVQVGQASESDAALDVRPVRVVQVGIAQEADSAPSVSAARAVRVGIAAQVDTALGATPVRLARLGLALEIEVALPIAPVRAVTAGLAAQSDVALPVSAARAVSVGLAAETDQAFGLMLDLPGLGVVINPSLLSRTPDRSLRGVSASRDIASRTPRRTVHEP